VKDVDHRASRGRLRHAGHQAVPAHHRLDRQAAGAGLDHRPDDGRGTWAVFKSPDLGAGFDTVVTDILSMFVVIELLKSLVEYFEVHRLKLTFIIDAAVVFLLREVMIGLYKHTMDGGLLAGVAALLVVLGVFRVAAVKFPPEVHHAAPQAG
jgi:hypothetical protein